MPLDGSKKVCDLFQIEEFSSTQSKFYSTYYLRGYNSAKEFSQATESVPEMYDRKVNVDREKTFPKIVFLGTVSAMASLQRNNTSILVHNT